MVRLYHKDVFFPAQLLRICQRGLMQLVLSHHAREAKRNDRYGSFEIPAILDTVAATVIEAETTYGKVTKIVYRTSYSLNHDLVIVVIPQTGLVKTAWLNCRNDKHKNLDVSKYEKG